MTGAKDRWLQAACLAAAFIATPCRAAGDWVEDAKGCKVAAQPGAASETVEWSGACRDGLAEGRGRLHRFSGGTLASTYDGDMKAGLYAGEGRLTGPTIPTLEGSFVAGRLEGRCVVTWTDGKRYDGECKADWPDGTGKLLFAEGDRYAGGMKAGRMEGKGRYRWPNGDSYEGDFDGDRLHGSGEYRFADGSRYTGAFSGGRPSGQGRAVLKDGMGYEGSFEGGVPRGAGLFFKPGKATLPDSLQNRERFMLPYARPQQVFIFVVQAQPRPVRAAQVCPKMGQPQVPPVNWQGEALYRAKVEVRDGSIASVAVTAPTPASNPVAHTRLVESIERAIQQTYVCTGNHVFVQEFQFRYERGRARC